MSSRRSSKSSHASSSSSRHIDPRRRSEAKKREEAKRAAEKEKKQLRAEAKAYKAQTNVLEDKKLPFLCDLPFRNDLPDLPFDPKLLPLPLDNKELTEYKPTSLESEYRYPLLTEADLGISLLLIEPDAYAAPPHSMSLFAAFLNNIHQLATEEMPLAPEDQELIELAESAKPSSGLGDIGNDSRPTTLLGTKRSRPRASLHWLRKTEYLDKTEATANFKSALAERKSRLTTATPDLPRDEQIALILKTFAAADKKIVHPDKPYLEAKQVYDIVPSTMLWPNDTHEVRFDTDPLALSTARSLLQKAAQANQIDADNNDDDGDEQTRKKARVVVPDADVEAFATFARTHAVLLPQQTSEGEAFMDFYIPTVAAWRETVDNDTPDVPPSELQLMRSYHYSIRNDAGNRFALELDDASRQAQYVGFKSRVHLRSIQAKSHGLLHHQRADVLRRSARALSAAEVAARDNKMSELGYAVHDENDDDSQKPSTQTASQDF